MALIGNLVTRENNTLQILQLSGSHQTLLAQELREGEVFDEAMIEAYIRKLKEASNIKVLTM